MMNCLKLVAVGLHLLSAHAQPAENNNNFGAYARSECGIQVGVFKDSLDNTNAYIAYTHEFGDGSIRPFLTGGLSSAYEHHLVGGAGLGFVVSARTTFRIAVIPSRNPAIHSMVELKF